MRLDLKSWHNVKAPSVSAVPGVCRQCTRLPTDTERSESRRTRDTAHTWLERGKSSLAGGHYVPNLAAALIDAKRAGGPQNIEGINLQGFLVGALLMRWYKGQRSVRCLVARVPHALVAVPSDLLAFHDLVNLLQVI